ncbi:MAG: ribonuclease P protein component [Nakamurella sp.]
MLPAGSRLHTSEDFAVVVRKGRRAGTRHLVVHLLGSERPTPPRAGFVVSGKVGNSVVRHRITRRLRPLVRQQLSLMPSGTDLVVRALPAAAGASSADLDRDLRSGVAAAERKAAGSRNRQQATAPAAMR